MEIEELKVIGGRGRGSCPEPVSSVTFKMGDVISIVGPTGSGKTELINDIERFADLNTPSMRKVLINGAVAPDEFLNDPSKNPVALITQHTGFLSDLPVRKFLGVHASIRQGGESERMVSATLDFANQLTGESIIEESAMTELSGGQTRALLIADAVVIGNSPIILLDEIENAGINRTKALDLLKRYKKIFIFVTHDPRIALLSDFRIVMKNGSMQKLVKADEKEKYVTEVVKKIDDLFSEFRSRIRDGTPLDEKEFRPLISEIHNVE
jgi:ABC-type lipoprotein export system ATPase subunit